MNLNKTKEEIAEEKARKKKLLIAATVGAITLGSIGGGTSLFIQHQSRQLFGTPEIALEKKLNALHPDTLEQIRDEDKERWIREYKKRSSSIGWKLTELLVGLFGAAGLIVTPIIVDKKKEKPIIIPPAPVTKGKGGKGK